MSIRFSDGDALPEDLLAATERLYRRAVDELDRALTMLSAGQLGEGKAAHSAASELRVAALKVLDERSKVDKLRKQSAGEVGANGALDFDAARTEIGRRLACLRDAGGSG